MKTSVRIIFEDGTDLDLYVGDVANVTKADGSTYHVCVLPGVYRVPGLLAFYRRAKQRILRWWNYEPIRSE